MITKIEVNGYRLLKEFSADLGPLTVVIGANAVGKSTLLDFLQCLSHCVEQPLNPALSWHWGIMSILSAAQRKDSTLFWRIHFKIPANPGASDPVLHEAQSLVYEVSIQTDVQGRAIPQYELLRSQDPYPGYAEPLKYLEATPFKRRIFSRDARRLVPFDDIVQRPAAEQGAAQPTVPINGKAITQPIQEPALMLSQIRFFNEFPVPSNARSLLSLLAFYPGFDITRFSTLRTKAAEIKPVAILYPNGENLGTVLHEMLTRYDYRSSMNELRDFLSAAYPTFEEIHCDTTYGTPPQVLVRVREKGMMRSMELWELSDGMLRFLCLATALLNPLLIPLVAIDEPEAGLHPRLLPVVADMIKMAAERTQILVTTHSPDLLNCFDLENVAVMSRTSEEPSANWYRPSSRETLIQMLKGVEGESLGDLHRSGELEAFS